MLKLKEFRNQTNESKEPTQMDSFENKKKKECEFFLDLVMKQIRYRKEKAADTDKVQRKKQGKREVGRRKRNQRTKLN